MTFSSKCKTEVEFGNNNHQELREALGRINLGDRTSWSAALSAACREVNEHFGHRTTCQIVLITEGVIEATLPPLLEEMQCKLHIVLLGSQKELQKSTASMQLLSRRTGGGFVPLDVAMGLHGIKTGMGEFLNNQFAAFKGTLRFGHLESPIRLYPPPSGATGIERALRENIEIHGFLPRVQVESPAVLSRHVIMPPHVPGDMLQQDTPDFRVLLYQVLKSDSLVALVRLGPSWFGFVCPFTEGKRTNMMLSVLDHGASFPWLGSIASLVNAPQINVKRKSIWVRSSSKDGDSKSGGGSSKVGPAEPSYAIDRSLTSPAVRNPKQLQLDLQRVLRLAGVLPNKRDAFFRELNKLRVVLLSFGMSAILKEEVMLLRKIEKKAIDEGDAGKDKAAILEDVLKQFELAEGDTKSKAVSTPIQDTLKPAKVTKPPPSAPGNALSSTIPPPAPTSTNDPGGGGGGEADAGNVRVSTSKRKASPTNVRSSNGGGPQEFGMGSGGGKRQGFNEKRIKQENSFG